MIQTLHAALALLIAAGHHQSNGSLIGVLACQIVLP
jgi:hypothetical protein